MFNTFLFVIFMAVLGITLASLVFGLFSLFKGGDFNRIYGNRAMRWRIILQAIALILFFLILTIGQKG